MQYFDEQELLERLLSSNYNLMRIVSPYQALPLREKITQTILTHINISLGNYAEEIAKKIIAAFGGEILEGKSSDKVVDCLFMYKGKTYLIEQKVRDDHDTSKRVGQATDFIEKKRIFRPDASACWFVDDNFHKNEKYYSTLFADELYYGDEINKFMYEIFGDIGNDFFSYYRRRIEEMRRELSSFNLTFVQPVRLEKISPARLRTLIEHCSKEDISTYFFAGNDYVEVIKNYNGPKKARFMELIAN